MEDQRTADALEAESSEAAAMPQLHRFMLVLEDNLATGELECSGIQTPEGHNPRSAAHIIGKFLQDNIAQVVAVAQEEHNLARRLSSTDPMVARKLVMPASQMGLVNHGPGPSTVIQVSGAGVASQG